MHRTKVYRRRLSLFGKVYNNVNDLFLILWYKKDISVCDCSYLTVVRLLGINKYESKLKIINKFIIDIQL